MRRSLPQTRGTLTVEGLERPISIRRDRWGMPHVRAETAPDLFFGQGFCHGQDRLWQLELYRRVAAGRIAEIAGEAGLPSDRLMRTLGLRRAAEREAAALEGEVKAGIEALCAGVNAAAAAAAAAPFELQLLRLRWEPWTAVDMLSSAKLLSFGLSTNWERELWRAELARELGPERAAILDPTYPEGNPIVLDPDGRGAPAALANRIDEIRAFLGMTAEATGSNNWAVSGERSTTGKPLIAGDPHLSPSMPGITYQMGLELGDRFARGASLAGQPGIVFGQNNDVVWTFTNVMADVMDLFVERIDGDRYRFEDEWLEIEEVEEEIRVRGHAEPERMKVRATHHGPIVNEALGADEGEPLALSWMGTMFRAVGDAQVSILDAGSGPELVELLAGTATPVSNLIWADRNSIGYHTMGRIPVRRGSSPDLPRAGWTGENEWEGWVPYDELPQIVDPDCGFIVTANNRIEPDDYPHHLTSEYLDGSRAKRIEEVLRSSHEHDLDGFATLQTDMLSLPGLETARRLARLPASGQREIRAIERLRSWDGRMGPDSVAATIYQAFTIRFAREFARAVIGDRDLCERWLDKASNGFLPHVTSPWRWQSHLLGLWDEDDSELIGRPWRGLALDALRGALDGLTEELGADLDGWSWGRAHPLEFPHALGAASPLLAKLLNRRVEIGGGQETVCQVGWDPNQPFKAIWAPCWRIVADPSDPSRSRWAQFTGNSGHPTSRHYDDLQGRWARGETQPLAGEAPWRALELEPAAP